MHKKLNDFHKKFTKFKDFNPRAKENEDLKANVLDNVGDLLNDLYYIYKERYEEGRNTLNKIDKQKTDYTNKDLTMIICMSLKKKINKLTRKNHQKKQKN